MHKFKNFNALHKQFFLFTHHKRDISHFLVVSPLCYPVVLGSTPRGGRGFFHVCALWEYTCLTLLPTAR